MKHLFIAAIAIFTFCNQSFGQANVYHPFPLNGGEWRADYFDSNCARICEQRRYYTSGDTIIDIVKYKKLYGDLVYEVGNSYFNIYLGALREDTINKKVFFWPAFGPEELILFNFNLDSGDLAPETYLHSEDDTMIVISIDSILVGNSYHKRYNLSSLTSYPIALIEGVGWSGGLILEKMYSLIGWEVIYNLKCLKVDQMIKYLDTSYIYPACDLPLTLNEFSEVKYKSVVYPNPASLGGTIYFNLSDPMQYEIRFFDVAGGFIIQVPHGRKTLDLSSHFFCKGVFLFEISRENQPIHLGKLIVN